MHTLPNIIYILADDMGYGDIKHNNPGCPFETPSFDRMCNDGMRFTDAHASSAVCTPSRYSILTGRYNWRSTLKSSVTGGYSKPIISEGRKTVADLLKMAGYRTCIFGKWHLGMEFATDKTFHEQPDFDACPGVDYAQPIRRGPTSNGFDTFYGISASLDMSPYVYIKDDRFTAIPDHTIEKSTGKEFWRSGPTAPGFVHSEVLDNLADCVVQEIQSNSDNPKFIYFPMPAPHTPILPAKEFIGRSHTNAYGDFVLHCDSVVGRVLDAVQESKQDTIVIFTSDNGCSPMANYPELAQHGHNPSYVFRGTKADIYEGGHHIPLIVQWNGHIDGGTTCNALVCLSDLMATVSDITQIPLAPDMGEDSISNLPLWLNTGIGHVREDLVHQSIDGSLSLRRGQWKLEMCPGSGGWSFPRPGVDDTSHLPTRQLYDLSSDISEQHNVIEEHEEIAASMQQRLAQIVRDGRSTPGPRQKNEGQEVWETISWMLEHH